MWDKLWNAAPNPESDDFWQQVQLESARNALLGAGAGALFTGVRGLLSGKKKKVGIDDLLRDVLLGGIIGGGGSYVFRGLQGLAAEADKDKNKNKNNNGEEGWGTWLWNKTKHYGGKTWDAAKHYGGKAVDFAEKEVLQPASERVQRIVNFFQPWGLDPNSDTASAAVIGASGIGGALAVDQIRKIHDSLTPLANNGRAKNAAIQLIDNAKSQVLQAASRLGAANDANVQSTLAQLDSLKGNIDSHNMRSFVDQMRGIENSVNTALADIVARRASSIARSEQVQPQISQVEQASRQLDSVASNRETNLDRWEADRTARQQEQEQLIEAAKGHFRDDVTSADALVTELAHTGRTFRGERLHPVEIQTMKEILRLPYTLPTSRRTGFLDAFSRQPDPAHAVFQPTPVQQAIERLATYVAHPDFAAPSLVDTFIEHWHTARPETFVEDLREKLNRAGEYDSQVEKYLRSISKEIARLGWNSPKIVGMEHGIRRLARSVVGNNADAVAEKVIKDLRSALQNTDPVARRDGILEAIRPLVDYAIRNNKQNGYKTFDRGTDQVRDAINAAFKVLQEQARTRDIESSRPRKEVPTPEWQQQFDTAYREAEKAWQEMESALRREAVRRGIPQERIPEVLQIARQRGLSHLQRELERVGRESYDPIRFKTKLPFKHRAKGAARAAFWFAFLAAVEEIYRRSVGPGSGLQSKRPTMPQYTMPRN